MKKILIKIDFGFNLLGINFPKFFYFFRGLGFYCRDYLNLKRQMKSKKEFVFGKYFPVLDERYSESGTMKGHYFHQDLLVAKKIYENHPLRHIDIGSRTDGFVAHVAAYKKNIPSIKNIIK